MGLSLDIKQRALRLGFDVAAITGTSAIAVEQAELLKEWLSAGYAGQMRYMHRNVELRVKPADFLENAKSIICLGLAYKPSGTKQPQQQSGGPVGAVASFAMYEDYHGFIKKLLKKLVEFINEKTGGGYKFRTCVDSAPLAERSLAVRAGLGFIGKNHMLINPVFGPQVLLGQIVTDLELEHDKPIEENCGGCDECIKACPAGALGPDGRFDARRCISYLTIEYKGRIESQLAEKIGDRVFGCDECMLACPYQQKGDECRNKNFKFYPQRANLNLEKIINLTGEQFSRQFADSPIERTGVEMLQRNARICLANLTG